MVQRVSRRQRGAFGRQIGHRVVEAGEELVRPDVECGQGADGGPHLPHGGRDMDSSPRYLADDHGDPCAGQRDGVVPLASPAAGHGYVGGFEGHPGNGAAREEVALDRGGDAVFPGVPAGVVEVQGDVVGHREREVDVVLVEGVPAAGAVQADGTEHRTTYGQRSREERPGGVRADHLAVRGVRRQPWRGGIQQRHTGAQIRQGLRIRGGGRKVADIAPGRGRQRALAPAAPERDAAQWGAGRHGRELRLVSAYHRIHHVDHGDIGELGHHRVHQRLARLRDVERPPRALTHRVQHPRTGTRPLPFGDIDHGDRQAEDLPLRTAQPEDRYLDITQAARVTPSAAAHDVLPHRHAAVQHAAGHGLDLVGFGEIVRVAHMAPQNVLGAHTRHVGGAGIETHHAQLGIQKDQADG